MRAKPQRQATPPIDVLAWGGFRVHQKRDGNDYLSLVERLRAGEAVGSTLAEHPGRSVRLVEAFGRRLVLKWDRTAMRRWEKRLGELLRGPYYSRLMPKVNRAVAAGCDVVQDIHLVAERVENGLCRETFLVLDYLPGTPFADRRECSLHADQVADALSVLHDHGLAMGDLNYRNFLLDGDRVRIIDLSARGGFFLSRAKDRSRVRLMYKIALPCGSPVHRVVDLGVHLHQAVFYMLRHARNKSKVNLLHGKKKPQS
ncbi:MAG: hypothetical protein LBT97_06340 [Planctomycetota bacterium]|jgi:hypothetical protein|nr:hypothetical protein [Planctomycetota bacterium]